MNPHNFCTVFYHLPNYQLCLNLFSGKKHILYLNRLYTSLLWAMFTPRTVALTQRPFRMLAIPLGEYVLCGRSIPPTSPSKLPRFGAVYLQPGAVFVSLLPWWYWVFSPSFFHFCCFQENLRKASGIEYITPPLPRSSTGTVVFKEGEVKIG